jgi:hypothetical protein
MLIASAAYVISFNFSDTFESGEVVRPVWMFDFNPTISEPKHATGGEFHTVGGGRTNADGGRNTAGKKLRAQGNFFPAPVAVAAE